MFSQLFRDRNFSIAGLRMSQVALQILPEETFQKRMHNAPHLQSQEQDSIDFLLSGQEPDSEEPRRQPPNVVCSVVIHLQTIFGANGKRKIDFELTIK